MTSIAAQEKEQVRQAAFKRRKALLADDRQLWSRMMTENFLQHIELPPAGSVISAYAPVNNEIDVVPLLTELIKKGYRCTVPYVVESEYRLAFLEWTPQTVMQRGIYDIPQPDPNEAEELVPNMLIVPMLAFDEQCHRMGYGSGQFDRTFASLQKIHPFRAIGVAFEAQKFDAVPVDHHDYTLDMVVTENNIYKTTERAV